MSIATPPAARDAEPEALIEEAWDLTRRRRRRRARAVAVALVVVGLVVAFGVSRSGGQVSGPGPGRPVGVGVAARFVGRVWYSRTIVSQLAPAPIVPRMMRAGEQSGPVPVVFFRTRVSYETWVGSDGSFRQRRVVLSRSFLSCAGSRRWMRAHQPSPQTDVRTGSDGLRVGDGEFPAGVNDSQSDPGDSLLTAHQLLTLPTSAQAISRLLLAAQRALTRRQMQAYVQGGPHHAVAVARLVRRNDHPGHLATAVLGSVSSLAISPISDPLRRRLLATTRLIPDVDTSISAQRVTLTAPVKNPTERVVFDRSTGQLLAGMPQATGTITAQGVVSSLRALPHGVRPIAARHLPPPLLPTLTPTTGSADTVFTVILPATTVATAGAPHVMAMMTGPTGSDCHYQYSKSGTARIPPGTTNGSIDSFAVSPAAIGRNSWCPGRYGLQIAIGATLGTGHGSTVYFTIHSRTPRTRPILPDQRRDPGNPADSAAPIGRRLGAELLRRSDQAHETPEPAWIQKTAGSAETAASTRVLAAGMVLASSSCACSAGRDLLLISRAHETGHLAGCVWCTPGGRGP